MIECRRPLMLAARVSLALSARCSPRFEPMTRGPRSTSSRRGKFPTTQRCEQVDAWVVKVHSTNETTAQIEALWPESPPASGAADSDVDLLDRVAESIAIVDPRAAQLVRLCRPTTRAPNCRVPPGSLKATCRRWFAIT